jgi:multimeric flavodoxin WrbA
MKILGICGSFRKGGNSDWMVGTVLGSSKEAGAEIELVKLRELKIGYCTGCDSCHNNGGQCILKDDMQTIYPKLLEADILIARASISAVEGRIVGLKQTRMTHFDSQALNRRGA